MTARKSVASSAVASLAIVLAVSASMLWAQTQKKADWLADGGDPERTAWQRNETLLTKDTVKNMQTTAQAVVPRADVVTHIKAQLAAE